MHLVQSDVLICTVYRVTVLRCSVKEQEKPTVQL